MRKTLLLVYFLMISVFLFGQDEITVRGTVTDSENLGIPGVSVVIEGTSQGTITDMDGNYNISVPSDANLVFSFVGMETVTVPVDGRNVIDVRMTSSTVDLDEVVVVGYGEIKAKDLTSSIATVKSEELNKTPTGQAMQALQGKVAGVQIVSAGAPGSEPTVRIRGLGSYPGTSDNQPLYVVDGVFYNSIDFLNPSDIETLSVLKDASASAIYGVRAANGVVLITTKKGSFNEEARITYDGYIGVQVSQNVLKMSNAEQYVGYVEQTGSADDLQFVENAMQRFGRSRVNPNIPAVNTDWYAEIMKKAARQQNHSITITGGSEKTAYSLGASYFEQQGLLETAENSYERFNIRAKLDQDVNNWLKAGVNFNLSNVQRYEADDAAWFRAYHAVPILPKYDMENYESLLEAEITGASPYSSAQLLGYRGSQNPFLSLDYRNNRQDVRKLLAGVYTEISIIPNKLRFKTSYNVALRAAKKRNVGLPYFISNETNRDLSSINVTKATNYDQFLDNVLTYSNSFGNHNITAMIGQSYRDEWWDEMEGSADDIPFQENAWYIDQTRASESKEVFDNAERIYGLSYFGRLSYNFDGRYLAYFTLRRDGTSKYQEKWGTFPAVGLGWVLSEEPFFSGVDVIDFLKFRAGWGRLGNDKIARQDGQDTTNPVYLAIDDTRVNGTITTSTFGYLGWETIEETNIGLTANLLNNRLSLEADYFIRDTEDAAIPVNLKLQPGSVLRNVGVIRNSGLEVVMNWNGEITNDLKYSVGVNASTLKNEVRDLYGQQYLNGGQAEFRQRSQVGEPLLSFYGYEVAGVYQNQAEIDADPVAQENGLVPGDFKFKDQDGNNVIDDDDKVFLGSYFPKLTYGASLGLTYKNLEFSMNVMGQSGNKILNRKRGEIIWTNDTNFDAELATNLWNGEGTSNRYPSAAGLRRGWNQNFSDYLVEDGSFFRIQNVQLGYNINGARLFGEGMPNAKIVFTAERPLTVFDYNGFNPEVPDGVDRQFYPVPSVYTVGLNVKF